MTGFTRRELGLVALGALFLPAGAHAAPQEGVDLPDDFTQGGLYAGRASEGATIALDDKPLRVGPNNIFVFGFGRDHGPTAKLTVQRTGMAPEIWPLKIVARTYQIQRIDGLPDGMVTPPDEVLERIKRENAKIGAARARDTMPGAGFALDIDWPVTGPISGVYGSQRILNGEPRRPHFGVDIAAGEGTPIRAPMEGIVSMAEPDLYYTGGTVILDHGLGVSTSYLHMSRIDVALDQPVAKGAVIGAIGKTGRATGPHLCWRLNWFQERLDPQLAAGPMPS